MLETGRVTLGRVVGIAIRVHRSWVIIALLIAWSLYGRYALDDRGLALTIIMATVGTILFFVSVLVHELAHSLEAQHRGVEVRGITLFLFGGATETSFDVDRPRDEFALTAVGPFSSLVLGGLFGLLAHYSTVAGLEPVGVVAGTLGWVNVALALFNLLPGAPLDGGRILRSAVWAITGDRAKAVRVASRSGQVLGYLVAGLGLLQIFFVPGGLVGGLWFGFIGWFLAQAASSERKVQDLKEALAGMTVSELVDPAPLRSIPADAAVEEAAAQLRRSNEDVLSVEDGQRTVGVLTLTEVADVPPDDRTSVPARDAMVPLASLRTVPAATEIGELLHAASGDRPLVVTATEDEEQPIGIVSPDRLKKVLERADRLGRPPQLDRATPDEHIPTGDGW